MKIYESALELVGATPLVHLGRIEQTLSLGAHIYAKLEAKNPAGSAKDRVARKMIEDAEASGKLTPGSTIIEPTSGNTGIGLAAVAAIKGYRVIIVMPSTMSLERQKLIRAYGAEVVLSDGALGMSGAIALAEEIAKKTESSFIAGQFENPSNPEAHYETTGPEIYSDTDGKVDVFVAGVGTGGTLSGVGRYLKEKNKSIKVIAVEPKSSPLLSEGKSGAHGLQGIGANFIPRTLDTEIYDGIITVTEDEAYEAARLLARREGLLIGISSGAALHAATLLAKKEEYKDKNIVVLLPDTGERYLSTTLFE